VEFEIEKSREYGIESDNDMFNTFVRPFDLTYAPLLRVGVAETGEGKHILMVDMHHITSDGVSHQVLIKDFTALYAGESLPPLRLQYKDYSQWQAIQKGTETLQKQETFWLKQFEEDIPVLDLPTDYPRPAVQSFKGRSFDFRLSVEDSRGLRGVALETGSTLFMVLLSLTTVLLSKLSGQEDIVIGTPIAGRRHADLEKIIGVFVNTLALRNYPSGTQSFKEFLKKVKERTLRAFENQEWQFEDLVEQLPVNRNTGRNPLFDVMFTFQTIDGDVAETAPGSEHQERKPGEEKTTEEIPISNQNMGERQTAKFDLALNGVEKNGELFFSLGYSTKLFKSETIGRYIGYLREALTSILDEPGKKISQIEIIPQQEKKQILYDFNDTETTYPSDKTLHQLFVQQVLKTPDSISIVGSAAGPGVDTAGDGEVTDSSITSITYSELNRQTDQLAHVLRRKGVQADTIVGIMVERSIEMVIGLLGILKAGGAYLPIDIDYPAERINYMLKDSNASVLLKFEIRNSKSRGDQTNPNDQNTNERNKNQCFPYTVLNFEDLNFELLKGCPGLGLSNFDIRASDLSPSGLAYIIYTSGTTGRPKGVLVEHHSAVNTVTWFGRTYNLLPGTHVLSMSDYTFDPSVNQVFGSLLHAAALHIPGKSLLINIPLLRRYIERHRINIVNFVPMLFDELLGNGPKLKSIQAVLAGGERLDESIKDKIIKKGYSLYNQYGPTETTIDAVVDKCSTQKVTLGRPIANTRCYILDKSHHLLPIGVAGQLYIGGDGVARGYMNKPDLTEERFALPGTIHESTLLYRTGDLALWLTNGKIQFLGRLDSQMKIRGFRVEPGEVENRLLTDTNIKDAAVIARSNDSGEKYLCAYFTAVKDIDSLELRDRLSQSLPDYMIPAYFIELESLPLTPQGKIDRKSLPVPGTQADSAYVPPRDEIESMLAVIWSSVLGQVGDRVPGARGELLIGIDDNFFELGGHSLKAVVILSRIHKELNFKIPLAQLFKAPTIRGIARYIKTTEENIYHSIAPVEMKEYYPLSHAQKRLYILQQMDSKNTAYNMPEIIPLQVIPDVKQFETAFTRLIKRHESLRTSFQTIHHQPIQKVHPAEGTQFSIRYYDRSQLESHGADTFIRPFDLSLSPLLRAVLVKFTGDRHALIVDMHHIICDGVSHEILVKDFMALFNGEQLPHLRIQYKDFAQWQYNENQKRTLKQQEIYWLKEFEGEIPVLNPPCDYPRPVIRSFAGNQVSSRINRLETAMLKELALKEGITLYMLLLTIINIFLSKITNQYDIVVGTPVAGRRHADLEKIIGMFVNTLAIRNYPENGKTFRHFLTEVKETTLKAFENQEYPFEELVEKASVIRDTSRNPLFDFMFVLQNFSNNEVSMQEEQDAVESTSNENREIHGYTHRITKFDITLTLIESGSNLYFTLEYCTRLFKKETIRHFIGYLNTITSSLLEDNTQLISEIEIISEEEKYQLLIAFNDTAVEYPAGKTLHECFEEQVGRTPDHIAVAGMVDRAKEIEAGNTHHDNILSRSFVTYKELNKMSNRLADILLDKGVKPGIIVALMMDRSIELIACLLGILKSGGSYLPIEPDYPQERIDFMLWDSNAKIMLGDGRSSSLTGSIEFLELPQAVRDNSATLKERSNSLSKAAGPGDIAYVIYTSGSTGKPKGVLIEHNSVVNLAFSQKKRFKINENDRILQVSSISFDASVEQIFIALFSGAALVLIDKETLLDTESFERFILLRSITHLHAVPSFLNNISIENPFPLKRIISGGDVCSAALAKRLSGYPDGEFYNEYGPTETTVTSIEIKIEAADETLQRVPIGRPIDNTRVYLFDKCLNPVPIGVAGEMYIGGVGTARGYLNRPELTVERFIYSGLQMTNQVILHGIPDVPTSGPYTRIYRTGDQARWLRDGNIEFLGRMDNQVKLRGYRIEPGEIENQLLRHPGIKSAIVLARSRQDGDRYLCAYIVPVTGGIVSGNEELADKADLISIRLRDYLSGFLPDYMIPSFFMLIEQVPLNSSGKIDKKALPSPEVKAGESYLAPRNEIETKLVEIWSKLLEIQGNHIGIDDNFFQLGGHSLKAT
ncbi:MAG: amino acid adenylation domain-containing protein, partial [bacterium]|nr:amino acid adenylation domain-containing protein [bacterium]